MNEIWKDIRGFEGYYQVSTHSRVRSLDRIIVYETGRKQFYPGIILSQILSGDGYLYVKLSVGNRVSPNRIHRLVAEAFIPNPENKPEINHKDGNKQNNQSSNLEWATRIENQQHAIRTGLIPTKVKNGKGSKALIQFTRSGELIREWPSMIEVQRSLGFHQGNLSTGIKRGYKHIYGFKWVYKEDYESTE